MQGWDLARTKGQTEGRANRGPSGTQDLGAGTGGGNSLFHFMQTLTPALEELRNNTEPRGVCPHLPTRHGKNLAEWGWSPRVQKSLSLGRDSGVAQVEGRGPFSPEEKCTDGVQAPRQGGPILTADWQWAGQAGVLHSGRP